ncbi:MAG: hypothetical protein ACOWWH_00915 [Eubacteriaceae bacterium]
MEKVERKYRAYHKKNKYMCEIDEVRKDCKEKIIAVHIKNARWENANNYKITEV